MELLTNRYGQKLINFGLKSGKLYYLLNFMNLPKDKTKEECLKFWNDLIIKIETNEYQFSRTSFSFSDKYTREEMIDYCNRMITKINAEK